MLKPKALRPGDRVAIVAPASPFNREEFERGLDEIEALGFVPVFDDSVFDRRGYVAGEPAARVAAIHDAWRNPEVRAIIAVRGGYGSVQLLPWLDAGLAREASKPFVGYSDTTSILIFLNQTVRQVCFHGPMVAGRLAHGGAAYDRDSLLRALMRPEPLGRLAAPALRTINPGEASGVLAGGTLSQMVASLGTPYAFRPPDRSVLFIDEVAERPYRLDRMLTQLRLAGVLERASALVFGELPRCDEPSGAPSGYDVVADIARDFRGPVLFGFPSGHTENSFVTLPMGVQARVVSGATPALIIEEAAVE